MRARIKKILSLIGPYPYNPYLVLVFFFALFFSRFVPLVAYIPAGHLRWRAAGFVVLVAAFPSATYSIGAYLLNRFRVWSSKSLALYILEVSGFIYINFRLVPILNSFLIRITGHSSLTLAVLNINTFLAALVLGLIALALMHQAEKRIQVRLSVASHLVEQLKLDRAKLIQSDERLRRQTSQFLHDRVQSDLMVVALELKSSTGKTQEEIESVISRSVPSLERIRSVEVRHLAQLLTPNFEAGGLKAALDILVSQYKSSMDIDLKIDKSSENFDEEFRLGIYRIVEQALLNALLHGPAKRVLVSLSYTREKTIYLEVSDDGPGIPQGDSATGVGTAVIDSWVGILNGKKTVESQPGHGYRLQVEFSK
jgi:signal transduction histidine kinase